MRLSSALHLQNIFVSHGRGGAYELPLPKLLFVGDGLEGHRRRHLCHRAVHHFDGRAGHVEMTKPEQAVTANQFRRLALSLPETVEQSHMDHPDFRVGGKIFATLGPDEDWGMVKLTPEQQASFIAAEPKTFQPINGAWGRRGCTKVSLAAGKKASVLPALVAAWRNTAPKRLVEEFDA